MWSQGKACCCYFYVCLDNIDVSNNCLQLYFPDLLLFSVPNVRTTLTKQCLDCFCSYCNFTKKLISPHLNGLKETFSQHCYYIDGL